MRINRRYSECVLAWALLAQCCLPALAHAEEPNASPAVKGEWRTVDGLRIMRLWGTPREQGFAQGYLLGAEAIKLLDSDLRGAMKSGGKKTYETDTQALADSMIVQPAYRDELEGIIEGLKARLSGDITIPALARPLEYRDLLSINCEPELAGVNCSSFAAWGAMTPNGETIAGRNLDWYYEPALNEQDDLQLLVVRTAGPDANHIGWVSLTWPLFIGCLTGMNAEGVTICMHDVLDLDPTRSTGLTPRGLALREAIEAAHASSAVEDVAKALRKRRCMVGNIVPMTMPHTSKGPASVVFEYDADTDRDGGVTIRSAPPEESKSACSLVCTNHYRKRAEPSPCYRYSALDEQLRSWSSKNRTVSVDAAWKLLGSVAMQGPILTYQSVVFEPNRRLMHISLSQGGKKATKSKPVTVNVAQLLSSAQFDR